MADSLTELARPAGPYLLMGGSFVHKIIIAGCMRLAGPLPSGPHQEGRHAVPGPASPTAAHFPRPLPGRLDRGDPDRAAGRRGRRDIRHPRRRASGRVAATRAVFPTGHAAATTTSDPRTEVVARLKEILKVRDKAFHDRNPRLLSAVYTVDCPCLEGDTNAIKELVGRNYHLIGGGTSIRVRRVERVNSRLWLVIADFDSAPLRIETKSGDLVRQEPAGSDLFQFALAKPVDATEWLLGRASAYNDG